MLDVKPPNLREIEIAVRLLGSVIPGRTAIYVSAPITTGKRLLEWRQNQNGLPPEVTQEHQRHLQKLVLEANLADALELIRSLREGSGGLYIDPSALPTIDGWTQSDFRHLWSSVIERYAQKVIFLDGWQFSDGCALEFLVAQRSGISTVSQALAPITLAEGTRAIQAAITEAKSLNSSAEFLEAVNAGLVDLQSATRRTEATGIGQQ